MYVCVCDRIKFKNLVFWASTSTSDVFICDWVNEMDLYLGALGSWHADGDCAPPGFVVPETHCDHDKPNLVT